MAEDERALLENLPDLVPQGVIARALHRRHVLLEGDETLELAGIEFETLHVPGHSPGHLAYHADGCLFSGDVLFAGSVGRTDLPGADWETLVESIRVAERALPARDDRLLRPRPADDARRGARAQPLPRPAARLVTTFEAPRGTHDILPSEQPLWRLVTSEAERLCSLYGYRPIQTPVFEDTALFLRTSGCGLRRRAQGDVHLRGPRRPLADAAARGHRADRPRVPRARPAPRGAAGQALHDRDHVPVRGAAARALPRALAALGRGDRLVRPRGRRGGHPALRRAARAARDHPLQAPAELDRRRRTAGRPTSSS